MSTRADDAAERWARGLYALRSEPSPQDAYRWGYEQAEREIWGAVLKIAESHLNEPGFGYLLRDKLLRAASKAQR